MTLLAHSCIEDKTTRWLIFRHYLFTKDPERKSKAGKTNQNFLHCTLKPQQYTHNKNDVMQLIFSVYWVKRRWADAARITERICYSFLNYFTFWIKINLILMLLISYNTQIIFCHYLDIIKSILIVLTLWFVLNTE